MSNVSSSNGLEKYPKLRFKDFSEPWETVFLRDVAEYRRTRHSVKKCDYISTENMLQNYMGVTLYTDFTDIEGIEYSIGDTLLANIRPYLKKVWFANQNGACSADVLAIKPTNVTPEYLFDILAQDGFIEYVMSGVKGSKMPRGDKSHIMNYETAIPSCAEQEKIAYFLRLISTRIQKIQLLIEYLKKYKRGLVSAILSEKIKISVEPWEECTIGDFLASKSIKQLPTEEAPLMAFTATGGVCDKGERYDRGFLVKDASTKLYKRTDYGDFIYSSNNLDVGSIGLNLYGSAVISDVYEIFSINDADPWFISEVIQQKSVMKDILKYRQGCLYGQYRIYAEEFLSVKIRIPSLSIQGKIGAIISQIESKILAEQKLLDNLGKCKSALLQNMFI